MLDDTVDFIFCLESMKSKKKPTYLEQRKKQLIEDNEREDQTIKKLTKKLGLRNRKPRKDGIKKDPTWMRDSGLDCMYCYFSILIFLDLLNFEKYGQNSDKEDHGGGILGETTAKPKKSRFFSFELIS